MDSLAGDNGVDSFGTSATFFGVFFGVFLEVRVLVGEGFSTFESFSSGAELVPPSAT